MTNVIVLGSFFQNPHWLNIKYILCYNLNMVNKENLVNNLNANFINGDPITKEFISTVVLTAISKDSSIIIDKEIYEEMMFEMQKKLKKIESMTIINYGSIILTTLVILLSFVFIAKQSLLISSIGGLLYLCVDMFALYKTNYQKIEKKLQTLYSKNVPAKVLDDSKLLLGEINNGK